jgi:hypothetical protein
MKIVTTSLAAFGAATLLGLASYGAADAQPMMTPTPAVAHGDWTLRQRENWLNDRLDKSRDDGAIDRASYDQAKLDMGDLRQQEDAMRDAAHGQLTDNQNADLEARLDTMAAKIHWANMATYARPW